MAITATTATTLPIMITMDLPQALQAIIKDTAFTMARNHTMDHQEARHMATTAMALIMVPAPMALVLMPAARRDLTNPTAPAAFMAGLETCRLHMSMQLEAPGDLLTITMAPNMARHQKGLDIDVVAMDLDMVPECTMAVLQVALRRMNWAPQVVMNPMVRSMDTMGPVDTMDR